MELLSQLDSKWAHLPIGNTNYKIGRWGCTLTSLCMLLSKFHPEAFPLPPDAARRFTFNANAEIIWTLTNFDGMKFVHRGYGYDPAKAFELAAAKDKGLILQVNSSHWIAVAGVENGQIIVHDPIDGKRYVGVPAKYTVTGYASFDKVEKVVQASEYAKPAIEKCMKSGVAVGWDNPKEIVCNGTAELMFMRTGLLSRKTSQGGVTKEDLAVMLDKLGKLN